MLRPEVLAHLRGLELPLNGDLLHAGRRPRRAHVVALLEPVHNKYPDISYADLYTLAGATALEAAGLKVPWKAGRVDQKLRDVPAETASLQGGQLECGCARGAPRRSYAGLLAI